MDHITLYTVPGAWGELNECLLLTEEAIIGVPSMEGFAKIVQLEKTLKRWHL